MEHQNLHRKLGCRNSSLVFQVFPAHYFFLYFYFLAVFDADGLRVDGAGVVGVVDDGELFHLDLDGIVVEVHHLGDVEVVDIHCKYRIVYILRVDTDAIKRFHLKLNLHEYVFIRLTCLYLRLGQPLLRNQYRFSCAKYLLVLEGLILCDFFFAEFLLVVSEHQAACLLFDYVAFHLEVAEKAEEAVHFVGVPEHLQSTCYVELDLHISRMLFALARIPLHTDTNAFRRSDERGKTDALVGFV